MCGLRPLIIKTRGLLLGSVRAFLVFYIRALNLLLGPASKTNFGQYFICAMMRYEKMLFDSEIEKPVFTSSTAQGGGGSFRIGNL